MKNKDNYTYKLQVNKVLSTYPQNKINIYTLTDENFKVVDKVFNYMMELTNNLSGKTNNYIIKLLIGIKDYLNYYKQIEKEIDRKYLTIIHSLKDIYNNLLNNELKEPDKNIIKLIDEINEYTDKNCPQSDEKDNNQNEKNITQEILEKDKKINELSRDIELLNNRVDSLSNKVKNADTIKKNLHKDIKQLHLELEKIKKDNLKLLEKNQLLDNDNCYIKELNNTLNNELLNLKDENKRLLISITTLKEQLKELKQIISEYEKHDKKNQDNLNKAKIIDNLIISKIIYQKYTINQIIDEVRKEQPDYSTTDIKESLKRISKKMNIFVNSIPQQYMAHQPLIVTNGEFEIYHKDNKYDLIVTSDWHISGEKINDKLHSKIDDIYEYCTKNHIKLILNLGDFLDVQQKDELTRYNENMNLLDNIINSFPEDLNISHAILGGNHDKRMLQIGVDPIDYIVSNRNDFINLGYDSASLSLNEFELIGLHHPETYALSLSDIKNNQKAILEYLKTFHKENKKNGKNTYLDIFGHFHISRFDFINSYSFIPSFTKNNIRNNSGFWHVELYFDNNNKIDYIIIKSLVNDKQITPVNEFIYTKKK